MELSIPPCIESPPHPNHPPSPDRPLRIHIQGPVVSIRRLLPDVQFTDDWTLPFPQTIGPPLAVLAFTAIYGRPMATGERAKVRDEYKGHTQGQNEFGTRYEYYGVTFDWKVPEEDLDPEILAVNIIEMEEDRGEFANGVEFARQHLRVQVDPAEYLGKKVLAVPRCCQKKRGTGDRTRINGEVEERDERMKAEAVRLAADQNIGNAHYGAHNLSIANFNRHVIKS